MIVHGFEYAINKDGVLQQVNPEIIKYDFDYILDRYGNIPDKRANMSHLRFAYMMGCIGKPYKLLEIGYGAGDFIKLCADSGIECLGHDITGIPTPQGVQYTESIYDHVDVVCMFDVLEHFEDINFIKNLNTQFVYVSVPNCSMPNDLGYLTYAYPHLRPNEHLHHFNAESLVKHFRRNGYILKAMSNVEDIIRKRPNIDINIISAIFVKE
jgi:hypothetical protein